MAVDVSHEPAARVRALAEHGSSVEVDPAVPIRRYFRSGQELIRMANVYHEEQNWESAFILYSKFITIFVEKLPKHPQYKGSRPEDLKSSKKNLKIAFPKAEDTKKKLTLKYGEEYKVWEQHELKRKAEERRRREEEERREAERQRKLQAQEEELQRLQEEREKSIMEEQIRQLDEQRNAILQEQDRTRQMEREQEERRRMEEQERARQMEEQRRRQEAAAAAGVAAAAAGGISAIGGVPSIPPPSYEMVDSIRNQGVRPQNSAIYAPTPFANSTLPDTRLSPTAPPSNSTPPVVDRSTKVDRTTKPAHLMNTVNKERNKYGLRDLYVPVDIMPKFLDMAKQNTVKNLETCGILAGKLSHDTFTITHTVIPKQTATSDSCTALNEEELFDVMDNNDLITLGWIHTHPSQTAFMSSIDLHTHCPYQLMMPEAIAIVCAPKHNETGMFSLTPDHGLRFIANCTEKGFHPHPKNPAIYQEGEHCKLVSNVNSQVIDLR